MAGHKAVLSVAINGDAKDAIAAFKRTAAQASAFGSFVGNIATQGVTRLWDTLKSFSSDIISMSDSTDKFKQTLSFAGLDTSAISNAQKATREYADKTVYDLSTIQNTTAQLAANGIKDYTGLTQAAGNLNAVAGGNADTFKSVAMVLTQTAGAGKLTTENWNQLSDAIPGASGKLQEAMLKNGAYTGNFRDAMAKGEITADEFNKAIRDLGMSDVAKQAAQSTSTFEGAIGNLQAAVVGAGNDILNIFKPAITSSLSSVADNVTDFASRAKTQIEDFITAFQHTDAFTALSDTVSHVGTAISSIGDAISAVISPLVDSFNPGIKSAADAGSAAGDTFTTISHAISAIADAFTTFGNFVKDNAEPISTALVGIGAGLAAFKVASFISMAVSALQGFSVATTAASVAQAALNIVMAANPIVLIITLLSALTAGLVYFFTQTKTGQAIWSAFTGFISGCVSNIIGFFSGLPSAIGGFFSGAANGARNAFNGLVNWVRGIPSAILGALGNVGSLLVNAGASIINGLLSGLKSAWNNVTGFVGGIASWIKEHKGPLSYDARLLIPAGTAIMSGFAQGLTSGFNSQVTSAISKVNNRMANLRLDTPTLLLAGTGYRPQQGTTNVTINVNGELIDDRTVGKIERMLQARAWERGR